MRDSVEFVAFAALAALIHVVALQTIESGAPVAAGAPGAGTTVMSGATGGLAELIETWNKDPQTADVDDLSVAEPADNSLDAPREMQVPDVEAPASEPVLLRAETASPAVLPQRQRPAPSEAPTAMPAPQPPVLSPPADSPPELSPEIALSLPKSPLATPLPLPLPPRPDGSPREVEPEPDPNTRPEIATRQAAVSAEPQPEIEDAPDRPVAPSRPTSLNKPDPVAPADPGPLRELEPEPEPTPAPVVAVLPKAKPEVPESARQRPPRRTPQREPRPEQARSESRPAEEPAAQPAASTAGAVQTGSWDAVQPPAAAQGAGGTALAGAHSAADVASARQGWLAEVRSAVQRRKSYPREAERRGIEGQSTVSITLDAGGRLVGATLAGSSGSSLLDDAAMAAVRGVGRYPPIPPEMREASVTIMLPFDFRRR
jgi:periplasmic protein TonB